MLWNQNPYHYDVDNHSHQCQRNFRISQASYCEDHIRLLSINTLWKCNSNSIHMHSIHELLKVTFLVFIPFDLNHKLSYTSDNSFNFVSTQPNFTNKQHDHIFSYLKREGINTHSNGCPSGYLLGLWVFEDHHWRCRQVSKWRKKQVRIFTSKF